MSYQITLYNETAKEYFKIKELINYLKDFDVNPLDFLNKLIQENLNKQISNNELTNKDSKTNLLNSTCDLDYKEYYEMIKLKRRFDNQCVITQDTDILSVPEIINQFALLLLYKGYDIEEDNDSQIKFIIKRIDNLPDDCLITVTISKNTTGVKSIKFKFYEPIHIDSKINKVINEKFYLLPMCLKDINEILNRVLK